MERRHLSWSAGILARMSAQRENSFDFEQTDY